MPEPSKPEPTCPKCGYSVLPEWTICTKCGNVLKPSSLLPTIERLEGLMAKATQGEWRSSDYTELPEGSRGVACDAVESFVIPPAYVSSEDSDCIAALHNAFPELAAGVRELTKLSDERGQCVVNLTNKLSELRATLREKDAELARLAGEVERLKDELAMWKPMTPEEAEAALDAVKDAPPISKEEIDRMVKFATDPANRLNNDEQTQIAAELSRLRQQVEGLRGLPEEWRKKAIASQEEGHRINRTVKCITSAEERCYARAALWNDCAAEIDTALSRQAQQPPSAEGDK
jgi:hypothetical protein